MDLWLTSSVRAFKHGLISFRFNCLLATAASAITRCTLYICVCLFASVAPFSLTSEISSKNEFIPLPYISLKLLSVFNTVNKQVTVNKYKFIIVNIVINFIFITLYSII